VRDFEPVSLFCDQLGKETVVEIEKLADSFSVNKSQSAIKKAIVKGIPRQAVLKPAHAVYRLQTQHFALGDRVTMVQDSGGVPLSAKGVVIGLNTKSMDVAWDVPFMSGTTLGDRCSQYRGSTVEFNTCLNLTSPQFVTSTNPKPVKRSPPPPRQRWGSPGAPPQAPPVLRPAPASQPVAIMTNPNRGGGRGFAPGMQRPAHVPPAAVGYVPPVMPHVVNPHAMRGGGPAFGRGRGGFVPAPAFRGRGFVPPHFADRGRGGGRGGGFRGRGRGGPFAPSASPLPS